MDRRELLMALAGALAHRTPRWTDRVVHEKSPNGELSAGTVELTTEHVDSNGTAYVGTFLAVEVNKPDGYQLFLMFPKGKARKKPAWDSEWTELTWDTPVMQRVSSTNR